MQNSFLLEFFVRVSLREQERRDQAKLVKIRRERGKNSSEEGDGEQSTGHGIGIRNS